MRDNNMNRRNSISNTGAQGTRSRNAASGNCPGAATRRAGKVTSGGSANTHSRRGIFGAFLSVLMTVALVASFATGAYADDLKNTVPAGENYDQSHTITTQWPGNDGSTGDNDGSGNHNGSGNHDRTGDHGTAGSRRTRAGFLSCRKSRGGAPDKNRRAEFHECAEK